MNKNTDRYFKEQFSDFTTYVVPALKDENQDTGRARGGIFKEINSSEDGENKN